jgi:hypothetical protein
VTDLAKLAGYLLAVLTAGRIAYLWARKHGDSPDDATFTGVLAGVLWPIVAAVALALLPFIAIGWLVSRPTRADRATAREDVTHG